MAAAVGNLSPEALERLLHIGEAYFSVASVDQTHPRWLIVGKLDHLRAIDELVRAGLVSYRWNNREGVAFSELGAFLASRGFHCISVDPDGTTTYEADRDVAPADIDQLRQFQYHLTEKGTFARSAVIKTVVEILEATKAPQK